MSIPPIYKDKRLVHAWEYCDEDGEHVGTVARFEDSSGKDIVPFFKPNGSGYTIGGPSGPRPLYGLDALAAASPDQPVFVVEGEKAAGALRSFGLVAVTSQGGSKAAAKSDWTPLSGRRSAYLLPDHDEPGQEYIRDVAEVLRDLDAPPELFVVELPGLPDKGDICDWIAGRAPEWDQYGPVPETDRERVRGELNAEIERNARPFEPPGEVWPTPQHLPVGLPPVEPFVTELLPEPFRAWVMDISDRMQCAPDYPAVAAMVCLASTAGRQVGIRPKRHDDWTVIPNLWGAVIGRPGVLKSPAIGEPRRFMDRMELFAKEAHGNALQDHKAAMMVAEARRKVASSDVKKALKGGDALSVAMAALDEMEPEEPARRRYITNDCTVEKLGELLRDNPRGVLIFRDELTGLLRSLDKEGRESTRAFYLEAWNGAGRFTYDRIGRGTIEIEAACVSILGGIQPGPLSNYMVQASSGGEGDDGLLQRFQLLVWPDIGTWRNVDRWPDTPARQRAWDVFARVNAFDIDSIHANEDSDDGIPWLRFDNAAQDEFDAWRETLELRIREDDEPPAFEAHLAKYRSLVPSLALLIHLAENQDGGPITHDCLIRALAWAEYLESHARRVYSQQLAPELAAAIELDRHILSCDLPAEFAPRDIYRRGWRFLDPGGTNAALHVLEDLDRIRGEVRQPGGTGGRPTTIYTANPRLGGGVQWSTSIK